MLNMAEYVEKFKLPSGGKLYSDPSWAEVEIRPMKVKEEKMIYGSSSSSAIDNILKACIVSPSNLDLKQLLPEDKFFLLYNLRIISFGSEYKVAVKCDNCNKLNEGIIVDLAKVDVSLLNDESLIEPFEVILSNEDVVTLRYLRVGDSDKIYSLAKERVRKYPQTTVDEWDFMLRIASSIIKINDKTLDSMGLEDYILNLYSKDSNLILDAINSLDFGVKPTFSCNCNGCRQEMIFAMPFNSEFFRPTGRYKGGSRI